MLSWLLLPDLSWTSHWYTLPTFEAAGGSIDMGVGTERRPTWVPFRGGLEGYLLSDLERRPFDTTPVSDIVTWWRMESSPVRSVPRSVTVDVPNGCLNCLGVSVDPTYPGRQGTSPSVATGNTVTAVIPAIPSGCVAEGEEVLLNYQRLQSFGTDGLGARPVFWPEEPPCPLEPVGVEDESVLLPSLVELSEERVGVFFVSLAASPPPPKYIVLSSGGTLLQDRRTVGGSHARQSTVVGGDQVRAVRLGMTVIFVEGYRRADHCHLIRLMNEDGSDLRDAPWQLPCVEDLTKATLSVELGTWGDVAVLAYSERHENGTFRLIPGEWFESVKVILLTEQGRLASMPLTITEPRSTARRGPYTRDFDVSLAAHEDSPPVVAWTDFRSDAPGVYARELTCRPLP